MKRFTVLVALLLACSIEAYAAPSARENSGSLNAVPIYDLSINVLPEAHRIEVIGTIRLSQARETRKSFELILSSYMRDFRVDVLEPTVSAGPARIEKKETTGESVKWDILPLRLIPAEETVLLKVSYVGGEQIASRSYIGPEGSFLDPNAAAWYPHRRDYKGTGTLRFVVPTGITVVTTGTSRSSAEEKARGHFVFDVNPSYFSFGAGKYILHERGGAVRVKMYSLRPRKNVDDYLDGSSEILRFLSQQFGPYPHARAHKHFSQLRRSNMYDIGFEKRFNNSCKSNRAFRLAQIHIHGKRASIKRPITMPVGLRLGQPAAERLRT